MNLQTVLTKFNRVMNNHQNSWNDIHLSFNKPTVETICYLIPVISVVYHLANFTFHHQTFIRCYKRDLSASSQSLFLKKIKDKIDGTEKKGIVAAAVHSVAGYVLKGRGYITTSSIFLQSSCFLVFAVLAGNYIARGTIKEIEKTEGKIF